MTVPSDASRREADAPGPSGAPTYDAARRAARSGRHADALGLVDAARRSGECPEVEALDLEARILAQQGRLGDAERRWVRAKELSGGGPRFDAALDRVHRLQRPGGGRLRAAALATVATVALAGLAVVEGRRTDRVCGELGRVRSAVGALEDRVVSIDRATSAGREDARRAVDGLASALSTVESRLDARLRPLPTDARVTALSEELRRQLVAGIEASLRRLEAAIAAAGADDARASVEAVEAVRDVARRVDRLGETVGGAVESVGRRAEARAEAARADASDTSRTLAARLDELDVGEDLASVQETLRELRHDVAALAEIVRDLARRGAEECPRSCPDAPDGG